MKSAFLMLLLAATAGCMVKTIDAKVMSSKALPIETVTGPRVRGEDCVSYFLFFPLGRRSQPNVSKALEKALEDSGGDMLVDVVAWTEGRGFPLLYMHRCDVIQGTVVNVKKP